jgi:hypothetical protein
MGISLANSEKQTKSKRKSKNKWLLKELDAKYKRKTSVFHHVN